MNNATPFPDVDLPEDVIEALFECKAADVRSFAQVADTYLAQIPDVLSSWNGTHTETCMALAVKVWMLRGLLEVGQRKGPSWAEVDRAIKLCKAVPLAPQRPLTAPPTVGAVTEVERVAQQHFVFAPPTATTAGRWTVATGLHRETAARAAAEDGA